MTTEHAPQIEPDNKDWTWVLDRPCSECGFAPAAVAPGQVAAAIRDNAAFWLGALSDSRAQQRPTSTVWSPTEYACHVRDVHRVFADRVDQMLVADDPVFPNWDQDETAVADAYERQRPADVARELAEAAEEAADRYDAVSGDAWERPGRRSNGSAFTVATLAVYHLHDVVHHRWDQAWLGLDVRG